MGEAARNLNEVRRRHEEAERYASMPDMSRRMRRSWRKDAAHWAEQQLVAEQAWEKIGEPIAARLEAAVETAAAEVTRLGDQHTVRQEWLRKHPDLDQRLDRIEHALKQSLGRNDGQTLRRRTHRAQIEEPDLGIEL